MECLPSSHLSTSITYHSDVICNTIDDEEVLIKCNENKINTLEDYLEVSEELGVYDKILGHYAPIYDNNINAEVIYNDDFADVNYVYVTIFRPLNEKEKKSKCDKSKIKKSQRPKFERHEDKIQESTLDDTFDDTDELHCHE